MPSVFFRTLGKEALCRRVPNKKHSAKKKTLGKKLLCQMFFFYTGQRSFFAECFFTLGKEDLCRVFFFTRQRQISKHILKQ
jgi:hypothetical protein